MQHSLITRDIERKVDSLGYNQDKHKSSDWNDILLQAYKEKRPVSIRPKKRKLDLPNAPNRLELSDGSDDESGGRGDDDNDDLVDDYGDGVDDGNEEEEERPAPTKTVAANKPKPKGSRLSSPDAVDASTSPEERNQDTDRRAEKIKRTVEPADISVYAAKQIADAEKRAADASSVADEARRRSEVLEEKLADLQAQFAELMASRSSLPATSGGGEGTGMAAPPDPFALPKTAVEPKKVSLGDAQNASINCKRVDTTSVQLERIRAVKERKSTTT